MRLIDADMLKVTITTDYYEHFTRYHDTDQIALVDMVIDDIDESPAVQPEPEWISVKDRLPEPKIPVLVCYVGCNDGKPYADGIANIRYGSWCWWEDNTSDNDDEVNVSITHWMPLPEPPKEDTE